jgi:hypothetical protein
VPLTCAVFQFSWPCGAERICPNPVRLFILRDRSAISNRSNVDLGSCYYAIQSLPFITVPMSLEKLTTGELFQSKVRSSRRAVPDSDHVALRSGGSRPLPSPNFSFPFRRSLGNMRLRLNRSTQFVPTIYSKRKILPAT